MCVASISSLVYFRNNAKILSYSTIVLLLYLTIQIRVPVVSNSLIQIHVPHCHRKVRHRRLTMQMCKIQSTELRIPKGQVHVGIDGDSDELDCL